MIGRIIGLAVVAFALLHGYFYVAFGTFDPCTAATFKVINNEQPGVVRDVGQLFSGAIDKAIRSKGILNCYRTAITGKRPDNLP